MKLLDTVALLESLPNFNLSRGQVGTVVDVHEPGAFEIDVDTQDYAYALHSILNEVRYKPQLNKYQTIDRSQ